MKGDVILTGAELPQGLCKAKATAPFNLASGEGRKVFGNFGPEAKQSIFPRKQWRMVT